jgi:lysophospholipase L1-like esterase
MLLVAVGSPAAEFPAPVAQIELREGDCLVFLGDSITHQCLYTQYVEDYFFTRMPHQRFRFHNAGVGGARAWDALQRFDRDVAQYKPKYVTVLLGMNDGSYRPFDQETFDRYHTDMTELVGRIKGIGAVPILMTPTMYDARAGRLRQPQRRPTAETLEFYNSVLSYYGTWLQEVAMAGGHGFVDMFHPLNQLTLRTRKSDPDFTMIPDAVHPGPAGQVVMACAIINDMQLPRQVSSIRIVIGNSGKPHPVVQGGVIEEITFEDDRLTFTWKADSLPWVLPEEAEMGVKLTKLGTRLSRESLRVHGLPPAKYKLSIDDTEVGTYGAAALGRGIQLQSNRKTPQYRQAQAVAELNKQRNEGPVRRLRGEWSLFQRYSRLAEQLAGSPDVEKLQAEVASRQKQLEGREERIAQAEREALEYEDKIFQSNQPQPRQYVLQRVP